LQVAISSQLILTSTTYPRTKPARRHFWKPARMAVVLHVTAKEGSRLWHRFAGQGRLCFQEGSRSVGEGDSLTARTYVSEESHNGIVPMNYSNNDKTSSAESGEGRPLIKENAGQPNTHPTQSGERVSQGLVGVRKAARENKEMRFTALLHHLTVDLLRESFYSLKRKAAPGVDGVTWHEYEAGLEERLIDLHGRVHRGAYRALPSRRVYIQKEDGRQRPLGVAALEDKIVQQAVVTILNQIYEEDFLGFSYGFRPGRSQHDALDALSYALLKKKVNYILDADIRGFFGAPGQARRFQRVRFPPRKGNEPSHRESSLGLMKVTT